MAFAWLFMCCSTCQSKCSLFLCCLRKYVSVQIKQNQESMTSTIKTAIRVRPLLPHQIQQQHVNTRLSVSPKNQEIIVNDGNGSKNYRCDHLILQDMKDEEIIDKLQIRKYVDKVLQGYNSTIFAYGQTGSGKTYTMQGNNQLQSSSITAQLASLLFTLTSQSRCRHTISISYLQIYNERIYDLLNPSSINNRNLNQNVEGLRLRWNKDQQFTVQNLFVFECKSYDQFLKYLNIGIKNRISASHKLNMQSSRSHAILSIKVETADNRNTLKTSRIDLVDLAGSERIGLTKTQGKLAKQSIDINKSLFTLRQVINVLSDSKRQDKVYVPYRDSKLTSILKQSIGGNSYCLMIACITPSDLYFQQNLSTLTYTTRASFITNNPILNLDPATKTIIQLKNQLGQVTSQLAKANKHIQLLSELKQQRQTQKTTTTAVLPQITSGYGAVGESQLPVPQFAKKSSEGVKLQYNNNISQRLIQSINMVRELLKSNKQLREKLEQAQQTIYIQSIDIEELTKQNQIIRENQGGVPIATSTEISANRKINNGTANKNVQSRYEEKNEKALYSSQQQTRRASLKLNNTGSLRPPSHQTRISSQSTTAKTQQFLDKLHLNQKGIDSAPTNFNKRIASSSQQQRNIYTRQSVQDSDRCAITAKLPKRGWLVKEGETRCFLSFYQGTHY